MNKNQFLNGLSALPLFSMLFPNRTVKLVVRRHLVSESCTNLLKLIYFTKDGASCN